MRGAHSRLFSLALRSFPETCLCLQCSISPVPMFVFISTTVSVSECPPPSPLTPTFITRLFIYLCMECVEVGRRQVAGALLPRGSWARDLGVWQVPLPTGDLADPFKNTSHTRWSGAGLTYFRMTSVYLSRSARTSFPDKVTFWPRVQ